MSNDSQAGVFVIESGGQTKCQFGVNQSGHHIWYSAVFALWAYEYTMCGGDARGVWASQGGYNLMINSQGHIVRDGACMRIVWNAIHTLIGNLFNFIFCKSGKFIELELSLYIYKQYV